MPCGNYELIPIVRDCKVERNFSAPARCYATPGDGFPHSVWQGRNYRQVMVERSPIRPPQRTNWRRGTLGRPVISSPSRFQPAALFREGVSPSVALARENPFRSAFRNASPPPSERNASFSRPRRSSNDGQSAPSFSLSASPCFRLAIISSLRTQYLRPTTSVLHVPAALCPVVG